MKKYILILFAVCLIALSCGKNPVSNDKVPQSSVKPPVLAQQAKEPVDRIDFIHYKKNAKGGGGGGRTPTCYGLLGYQWATLPVNYSINTGNPQGLPQSFITSAISTAAETWDSATSKELFNNTYTIDSGAQYGVRDNKNSIVFGSYSNSNVIAVTSIWFTRYGKQIVEFDMLFNTYFTWGDATVNPAVMDLQNIATHELGHGAGLDDIYAVSCSTVTMYGYSDNGDIQKRTLEQPDITGLRAMYGN